MAHSIAELKKLSDEQLALAHDNAANSTMVGVTYYLDELRSREQDRLTKSMEKLSRRTLWLSFFVAIVAIVSVVYQVMSYYKT